MTSASEVCFTPEPPPPSNPAKGPQIALPYTHIWTELLKLGVAWDEALRMPWSVCRMLFESRAEAYEASRGHKKEEDDVRMATPEDIANWI